MKRIVPTKTEVFFDPGDIIVSKTDLKGRITYANKIFCDIAGYSLSETLGQPHNFIRHPDMPRCIFRLLWETLEKGDEIFAYVKNMTGKGDYYWVLAHVTPSRDSSGKIVGYHSNRRVPDRRILDSVIIPLYAQLLAEEQRHSNGKEAVMHGYQKFMSFVSEKNMPYEELVLAL